MSSNRFKFRVWNTVNKKYVHWGLHICEDGDLCDEVSLFDQTVFIVEQCTGLRDRNGNLIYDGDVVMWHRSTAWGLGGERRGHVFWHDKFGAFGVRSTLGDGFSINEIGECQIIGNIHDGKEY